MESSSRLQVAYESYLRTDFDRKHAETLLTELHTVGLSQEAQGLRNFSVDGETVFSIQDGPWQGCSCSASWTPPKNASLGDLWFDGVELVYAVFVAELPGFSSDARGWMSIRPVQRWQFAAFLQMAQPRSRLNGDRYDPERLAGGDPLAPVVDLYPDEAEAYALWFGKWSVGEIELSCAGRVLTPSRMELLSPSGLLLWDLSPPSSCWYYGVGFRPSSGELVKEEFCDCDRDPSVGFATYLLLKCSSRTLGWGHRMQSRT